MTGTPWTRRAARYRAEVANECEACGAVEGLAVHHRHGRGLMSPVGQELDDELATLCRQCHLEVHDLFGSRRRPRTRREARTLDWHTSKVIRRHRWGRLRNRALRSLRIDATG